MRRLDKAFAAFSRRLKAGQKPGYPRFKSRDRFDSIEFPSHGDGIRLNGNRLRVQHVGTIRVRVHREVVGTIKTARSSVRPTSGSWSSPATLAISGPLRATSRLWGSTWGWRRS
jgi:putative transposase